MTSEVRTDGTMLTIGRFDDEASDAGRVDGEDAPVIVAGGLRDEFGVADGREVAEDPEAKDDDVVEEHLGDECGAQADAKHRNGITNDRHFIGDLGEDPTLQDRPDELTDGAEGRRRMVDERVDGVKGGRGPNGGC